MIEIQVRDEVVQITGSLDLGYMGRYKDSEIMLYDDTPETIRRWRIVRDRVGEDASDEAVSACLTEYFNAFAQKIAKNRKQINDNFLIRVFFDMQIISYPFWEIKGLTRREFLPPNPEKTVYQPFGEAWRAAEPAYWQTPNDGSLDKPEIEARLRRDFPALNLDALLESIVPECAVLADGRISFQCSDGFGEEILCGAFDTMDETLAFLDWHNF